MKWIKEKKNTTKAKLKAASQEERNHLWKRHFKNLLAISSKVKDETITKMNNNQVDIQLGQFTHEEFDLVQTKILDKKTAALDEIPPEV